MSEITLPEASASTATVTAPNLLDEIMAQTRFKPESESYDIARQGVTAFITTLLQSNDETESVDILAVNGMIADIDERMSRQMDLILHAPEFQELESFLRSLKLLVDHADPRENIKIHLLHATKEELLDDFSFAPEITQSGFYRQVYATGFGQFGGEPVAAVIGNYAFNNTVADMKLLKYISSVSAMAHAPFLSSVSPEFLAWIRLPNSLVSEMLPPFLKVQRIRNGVRCVNRKMLVILV